MTLSKDDATQSQGPRRADPDKFRDCLNYVARHLFGKPNRDKSRGNEMRYGTHGSLCIYVGGPKKGTWSDFENDEGGGTLDLVMREKGFSTRAEAAQWCEDNGFVESDNKKRKANGKDPEEKKRVHGDRFPGLGKPAKTYDYTDAIGELLYQACRFVPKDFRPRQPDGNGSWYWDLQGLEDKLVLYRLPKILEARAAGRTLYHCEGEKDAEAGVAIGLDATCVQGGCGGGWRPQYNEAFKGADVVIIPHNDEAGRKHAEKVAASLKSIAAKIRILKLWESWQSCPDKADLYDWLQVPDHTREALDALVNALPEYEPTDAPAEAYTVDDFIAYLPAHQYIYTPTGELWPAASVDAKVDPIDKVMASRWLDQNKCVAQMTWAPGMPAVIADKTVKDSGWIDKPGVAVFNLYRTPVLVPGDASAAGPWVDHVRRVYPVNAEHIINYLAHRVQRPHEKINHGLVLGGAPGVGKDTLIEPVKRAVGPWNVAEISPVQVLGRFNGFIKSVILRISEARDLGEMNRFSFYEHLKAFLAAPPDVLRCDEKNLREHAVFNVMGVIITSNRKDSFYLPADDRRHYVAWTDATQGDFTEAYWRELWGWYDAGGDRHVAAYLAQHDLSIFDPKRPPAKTDAFWEIVETNRAPENSELDDVLDELGKPDPKNPGNIIRPDVVTLSMIRAMATDGLHEWLSDRKNSRQVPHRMSDCGYVPVRNEGPKDGLWVIGGKRQPIYAKADLSFRDRYVAATALVAASLPAQSELPGVRNR
jgi:Family of unknown function (DUF5906)